MVRALVSYLSNSDWINLEPGVTCGLGLLMVLPSLCCEGFSLFPSVLLHPKKNQHSKFQLDLKTVKKKNPLIECPWLKCLCYFFLFLSPLSSFFFSFFFFFSFPSCSPSFLLVLLLLVLFFLLLLLFFFLFSSSSSSFLLLLLFIFFFFFFSSSSSSFLLLLLFIFFFFFFFFSLFSFFSFCLLLS